jgi:ABC-type amino acid transport substrate-binding protein
VYLRSLPESERWRRAPYPWDKLVIDRLLDGTLDTAVIWQPALDATDHDPEGAGIRIIDSAPFTPPVLNFGIALRDRNRLIRTMLDQAIVRLIEDGTIARVLEQSDLPGQQRPLGR